MKPVMTIVLSIALFAVAGVLVGQIGNSDSACSMMIELDDHEIRITCEHGCQWKQAVL